MSNTLNRPATGSQEYFDAARGFLDKLMDFNDQISTRTEIHDLLGTIKVSYREDDLVKIEDQVFQIPDGLTLAHAHIQQPISRIDYMIGPLEIDGPLGLKLRNRWNPKWVYLDDGEIYTTPRMPHSLEMRKGLMLRSLEDTSRAIVVGNESTPDSPYIIPRDRRCQGGIIRKHGGCGFQLAKNVETAMDTEDADGMLAIVSGAISKIRSEGRPVPSNLFNSYHNWQTYNRP